MSSKKATTSKEAAQKEGVFISVTFVLCPIEHWFLASRKRVLSLMDKETEDETSQRPKKMKKTLCLRHDSEQGADQSDIKEEDQLAEEEDQLVEEEDQLAEEDQLVEEDQLEEEDDQLEDDADTDDNINQGNTNEEGGDGGDGDYMDDNTEKERESFIDLDDKVSTIDITVPLLLIRSSLFTDCGG